MIDVKKTQKFSSQFFQDVFPKHSSDCIFDFLEYLNQKQTVVDCILLRTPPPPPPPILICILSLFLDIYQTPSSIFSNI